MAIVTEVRFAHEDAALAGALAATSDLTVSVVRETSTAPDQSAFFYRFDDVEPDEIPPLLERDHTVRTASPVSAVENRRLWRIEFTPETKLLGPKVTNEGGIVLDARSTLPGVTPRGWRERWFFPDHDGIQTVWKGARSAGFEIDVLDLSQQLRPEAGLVDSEPLTDQQRTALVAAYERGYFNEPRETSLQQLAESLDVSPSAVNGRIRRGLKSLIESTLVVDASETDRSRSEEVAALRYRRTSNHLTAGPLTQGNDE